MEFQELLEKVKHLNKTCFPKAKLEHNLIHLQSEVDEVIKDPEDIIEWADMLICFVGGFGKTNFTIEQLSQACDKKIEINLNRTWVEQPNGTYKHLKD